MSLVDKVTKKGLLGSCPGPVRTTFLAMRNRSQHVFYCYTHVSLLFDKMIPHWYHFVKGIFFFFAPVLYSEIGLSLRGLNEYPDSGPGKYPTGSLKVKFFFWIHSFNSLAISMAFR